MPYLGPSAEFAYYSRYTYTAAGGETSISGSDDNGQSLAFTSGVHVSVTLNGVLLVPSTDYNTGTANTIAGLAALAGGDVLEVIVYSLFSVADAVPATGGTFSGNVTMNGDLTVDTNTLYVDSTNNNVGIGTSSPTASLTVGAADNEGTLRIGDNGTYYGEIKRINASDELRIGHYGASQKLTFHTVNTERMQLDSSGNLKFNSGYGSVATAYGCRAWVNFNGTGTVAIRGGGSVSSITDTGTGNYNVNFTTAMPDSVYSVVGLTGDIDWGGKIHTTAISTTSASIRTLTASGSTSNEADSTYVYVSVFR